MTPETFAQYLRAAKDAEVEALVFKSEGVELHATFRAPMVEMKFPVMPLNPLDNTDPPTGLLPSELATLGFGPRRLDVDPATDFSHLDEAMDELSDAPRGQE